MKDAKIIELISPNALLEMEEMKYHKTHESCLQFLDLCHEFYRIPLHVLLNCLFCKSTVDLSFLRFIIFSRLFQAKSSTVIENVSLFCLEIESIERPYQFYAFLSRTNQLDIFIRGTTTDSLMAYATYKPNSTYMTFHLTGRSDLHAILSKTLSTYYQEIISYLKQVASMLACHQASPPPTILLDSCVNIGHALQNEIGPFLLCRELSGRPINTTSSSNGCYKLNQMFYPPQAKPIGDLIKISPQITIWPNTIMPTGSNPSLGIYGSQKLCSAISYQLSKSTSKLLLKINSFNLCIYFSPRVDTKRGVCLNQSSLYDTFIRFLVGLQPSRTFLILYDTHSSSTSHCFREHNALVESLFRKHSDQVLLSNIHLELMPDVSLPEKLLLLKSAHAFVGAAGANVVTFFDWQGHEVPGIMYGDEDLITKGGYFKKLVSSVVTNKKIPGRYVLSGVNLCSQPASNYILQNYQIIHSCKGLLRIV